MSSIFEKTHKEWRKFVDEETNEEYVAMCYVFTDYDGNIVRVEIAE